MKTSRLTILLLSLCAITSTTSDARGRRKPVDMTVEGYRLFMEEMEKEIRQQIAEEFRERREELKLLSEPYKLGSEVAIAIVVGRGQIVRGRFAGIKGQHAEIGQRKVLLSDIDPIDRKRLEYGSNIQLLQVRLNRLSKELDEEEKKREALLREAAKKKAGYTKRFFEHTIEANGRYWEKRTLGHRKISLKLELTEKSDDIMCTVTNSSGFATEAVFLLDNEPVGSTAEWNRKKWQDGSFLIRKQDATDSPFDFIHDKLRILQMNPKVGSWYLRSLSSPRVSTFTKMDVPCPECGGSKDTVMTVTADDGTISETTRPCPTCSASGKLPSEAHKGRWGKLVFALTTRGPSKYTRNNHAKLRDMHKRAAEYQAAIVADRAESQLAVRTAREKREAAELAEKIAREKAAAARREMEERYAAIEGRYSWLTVDDARLIEPNIKPSDTATLNVFDDIAYPTLFDERPVERFTPWEKVSNADRTVYRRKYRILKVANENAAASYYFQYQLSLMRRVENEFVAALKLTYNDGTVDEWKDTFTLSPSWSGRQFVGNREMTIDQLDIGIDSIEITAELQDAEAVDVQAPSNLNLNDLIGGQGKENDKLDKKAQKKNKPKGFPF